MRRCSFQCSHSFIGLLCQQELERKPLREQLYGGSGTVAVFSHKNQNHIARTATEEGICWSLVLITELYDEKSWLIYQLNVGKKAKICIPVNFLEKNRAQRLVLVQFCNWKLRMLQKLNAHFQNFQRLNYALKCTAILKCYFDKTHDCVIRGDKNLMCVAIS